MTGGKFHKIQSNTCWMVGERQFCNEGGDSPYWGTLYDDGAVLQ